MDFTVTVTCDECGRIVHIWFPANGRTDLHRWSSLEQELEQSGRMIDHLGQRLCSACFIAKAGVTPEEWREELLSRFSDASPADIFEGARLWRAENVRRD